MPKSPNRNTPRISRERALQISNDVTEDCVNATKAELIETVRFWQGMADEWSELYQLRWHEVTNLGLAFLQNPFPKSDARNGKAGIVKPDKDEFQWWERRYPKPKRKKP